MRVAAAAKEMRKAYKNMEALPAGARVSVSTVKGQSAFVTIEGVPTDWLWCVVKHGNHGIPEVEMTPDAIELLAEVKRIANEYRETFDLGDGLTHYSYTANVSYDYKIRKPELQAV